LREGDEADVHAINGIIVRKIPAQSSDDAVLRKLDSVKFSERTPANVERTLSREEKQILAKLLEKGSVSLYKGGKYEKSGVYSIPRQVYEKLRQRVAQLPPRESLEAHGYAVVSNEAEAKELSQSLEADIRSGEVMGVRGFDKRFYVLKRDFFTNASARISDALARGDADVATLSEKTKTAADACIAVLEMLREQGEVVEKRKGYYSLL
jgi:hypothetical protein